MLMIFKMLDLYCFITLIIPDKIVSPLLYKDVIYTEHIAQIYPPFCCWSIVGWYRTLSSTRSQVWIQSVHSTKRFPWSIKKRIMLPCWSIECNVNWKLTKLKSIIFFHQQVNNSNCTAFITYSKESTLFSFKAKRAHDIIYKCYLKIFKIKKKNKTENVFARDENPVINFLTWNEK